MIYLRLFWEFFKTGLFAIGGGMATVPFLQDIASKTGWYTAGQLADMIAVSESTPGPMGVNMATYVGYTVGRGAYGVVGGILGSLTATIGLVCPSVICILIIAYFLDKFRTSKLVDNTLYGLRPASVALISAAGIEIMIYALFKMSSIYDFGSLVLVRSGAHRHPVCAQAEKTAPDRLHCRRSRVRHRAPHGRLSGRKKQAKGRCIPAAASFCSRIRRGDASRIS